MAEPQACLPFPLPHQHQKEVRAWETKEHGEDGIAENCIITHSKPGCLFLEKRKIFLLQYCRDTAKVAYGSVLNRLHFNLLSSEHCGVLLSTGACLKSD